MATFSGKKKGIKGFVVVDVVVVDLFCFSGKVGMKARRVLGGLLYSIRHRGSVVPKSMEMKKIILKSISVLTHRSGRQFLPSKRVFTRNLHGIKLKLREHSWSELACLFSVNVCGPYPASTLTSSSSLAFLRQQTSMGGTISLFIVVQIIRSPDFTQVNPHGPARLAL